MHMRNDCACTQCFKDLVRMHNSCACAVGGMTSSLSTLGDPHSQTVPARSYWLAKAAQSSFTWPEVSLHHTSCLGGMNRGLTMPGDMADCEITLGFYKSLRICAGQIGTNTLSALWQTFSNKNVGVPLILPGKWETHHRNIVTCGKHNV